MIDAEPPQRHLALAGAHNVRDLGGYPTANGGQTRWRQFLRSDSVHQLAPASQTALVAFGLRTAVDLRTTREVETAPNVFAGPSPVAYHHLNLMGDDPVDDVPVVGDVVGNMVELYTGWLDNRRAQIGGILQTLASPGALPALFHCAGGKDRTGVTTALILGLAGVPAETIADDYGLTARYLSPMYLAEAARHPTIETEDDYRRAFCPPAAMSRVLAHLDRVYGDVEGYVRAAGLTEAEIDRLRHAIAGPEAQG